LDVTKYDLSEFLHHIYASDPLMALKIFNNLSKEELNRLFNQQNAWKQPIEYEALKAASLLPLPDYVKEL